MPHSPTPWYLGKTLVDREEEGWDGTILSNPAEEEIQAEIAAGLEPEPFEVARVTDAQDARRIVQCVNAHDDLLAALEVTPCYGCSVRFGDDHPESVAQARNCVNCKAQRAAIAKAKAVQP